MRRAVVWVAEVLALLCVIAAVPLIWLAGFWRGVAVALHEAHRTPHPGAVLTEADMRALVASHELGIRQGSERIH